MTKNPRTLPHNLNAEASVLGGVLLRNDMLQQLPDLEVDDFYAFQHRTVFQAMRNLEEAGTRIDVVTLENEIEKAGKLDSIGGVAFLGQLALLVPTPDNVMHYGAIVREKSVIRRLGLAHGQLAERAYEPDLELDAYLGESMRTVSMLDRAKPDSAVQIGAFVRERMPELEEMARARADGSPVQVGIPTGVAELDKLLGGYPFGDLVLLACRPAMGKTAMAMASCDAATAAGYGAHVFSQEGGKRMYADRAISRASGISLTRLRAGDLYGDDAQGIVTAALKYHHRKNWLVDTRAYLTATEIIRCVRRHRAENGTRLVVVDYVQILKRPKGLERDEYQALDAIITEFAQAALADDITYLVISQLNREVEKRADKRPQMSDLRGSGALEERPRVIVSPYRSSYYHPDPLVGVDYDCTCIASSARGVSCKCMPSREEFVRMAQVLVLKNSNGPTGFVRATWNGETAGMS